MAYWQHPVIPYKPYKFQSQYADPLARYDLSYGIKPASIRAHRLPPTVAHSSVGTVSRIRTVGRRPAVLATTAPPLILTTTVQPGVASHPHARRHQPPVGGRPMAPRRHHHHHPLQPGAPVAPAHRGHRHRVPVRRY
ncbi:unnamed protein product [Rotaria sp. Silwood2]|nr:unnamed protein product [Rotaria sp. Silwood2]CAF2932323.1 unnamed protein product [Rotaria sp. Silwood2]CAF4024089.1 unnamed protein product [Rotaria sp. Silwood2]CAF4163972.1 unnamed protein product [Rotaria sp. Silwood2]